MGVDRPYIDAVKQWDGAEDLLASGESDVEEDDEGYSRMEEDEVTIPPAPVKEIYEEATPFLHQLKEDPDNASSLSELERLNATIQNGIKFENAKAVDESQLIPESQWLIPVGFFRPHYSQVVASYAILLQNPTNGTARKHVSEEKRLIDKCIQRNHFPAAWAVLSADDYLKANKEPPVPASPAPDVKSKRISYPWPTADTADGSLIVGIRRQGRWGTQACVERVEGGRIVRRLESASEVGLLEVEKYKDAKGHKNLAEGQSQWSSKDRGDFDEVLWVTKSQTQRKNLAANKKDPSADCCVRFNKKGIQILTLSSLNKVLGAVSARGQIEKVCHRDGIPPPWEAGNVAEYFDPAKVEKNSVRRRAMKDEQAEASSKAHRKAHRRSRGSSHQRNSAHEDDVTSEPEVEENGRLGDLEDKVAGLDDKMGEMADMLKKLLQAFGPAPPPSGN